MRDTTDPKSLVPQGAILIGANYKAKTGDLKHTLLMHDDVDPAVIDKIVRALPAMPVTRIRARKLHLPPKKQGDRARSYRHRLVLTPKRMETTLHDFTLAKTIADIVLKQFLENIQRVAQAATEEMA